MYDILEETLIYDVKLDSKKVSQEEYEESLQEGIDACKKIDKVTETYIGKRIFNLDKDDIYNDFVEKAYVFGQESLESFENENNEAS